MSAASAFYLRTYTRHRIFVEPGGTGKSGVWNRMLVFDIYGASVIIYLTRQPVREVKAPRPGELTVYKVSRPILPRFRAAYLLYSIMFDIWERSAIIYLSEQPEDRLHLSVLAIYFWLSKSPFLCQRAGRLTYFSDSVCAPFRLPG